MVSIILSNFILGVLVALAELYNEISLFVSVADSIVNRDFGRVLILVYEVEVPSG